MLAFRKMHGLGNDFVVLDARAKPVDLPESRIRAIGDRHRGIGFDQLLVIEPPTDGSTAFMRIYNPDGSEAQACGNGTRCVAHLLMDEAGSDEVAVQTRRGRLPSYRNSDGTVSVDMGAPMLDWQDIPLARDVDHLHLPIELEVLHDPVAVGMGNPHCVFFVPDAEAVDLSRLGPQIEHHPMFPERTNVEVASLGPDGVLRLRVWERGAGITLACGSGTCATAVAAHLRGHVDASEQPIRIRVDGGELAIQWRQDDGHVIMTGPIATSFLGEMAL
ncbi:diaminopimelate epimerase [Rhodospirillaceae bacterium KN72]|uniref:Diaminopimelate epimerase n=1 Tax=Pacificispira spongiicola TaxID=2729598 RepID=A0A7Y0HE56_9PROT|nr:diaminopimelate epimerase [Pacificispira spongiicola]NMM44511.1 diaminopimelate epimerase [Pacificispira spongiicola]